eukprot:COSAG04_NODE_13485_length_604_cov_1.009901_1_plen_126_part_10
MAHASGRVLRGAVPAGSAERLRLLLDRPLLSQPIRLLGALGAIALGIALGATIAVASGGRRRRRRRWWREQQQQQQQRVLDWAVRIPTRSVPTTITTTVSTSVIFSGERFLHLRGTAGTFLFEMMM